MGDIERLNDGNNKSEVIIYNTEDGKCKVDVRLKEDDSFFKGLTKEDGEVESVSIDGKDYFKDTTWFSRDAVVVITYYP